VQGEAETQRSTLERDKVLQRADRRSTFVGFLYVLKNLQYFEVKDDRTQWKVIVPLSFRLIFLVHSEMSEHNCLYYVSTSTSELKRHQGITCFQITAFMDSIIGP